MSSIYNEIWAADLKENGVPAILIPTDTTTARDNGYVVVNESSTFNKDTRILRQVDIPDSKKKTYDLCARLFDNYELRSNDVEVETTEEAQEIDDFIKMPFMTRPRCEWHDSIRGLNPHGPRVEGFHQNQVV